LVRNKNVWKFVRLFTNRFPSDVGPVIEKDIRIFFRDPAQWSQIFLLASLIVIYLFSVSSLPVDVVRGAYMQSFKDALAYLNLGMAGFVMAGIAVRFQFTAISGEGRAFWLMQSGPVDAKRFLWAKVIPGLLPMLFVGETLVLASNVILDSPTGLVVIEGLTVLALAFGISGIAGGVGAYFPDFKADNAAKAAAGPGGILFMVLSLSLVFLVLVIEGLPVWYMLRQGLNSIPLTTGELVVSSLCFSLSLLVCWLAAVLPIRRASVGLWERN
jgi:ABC-2 type transport system permease protein